MKKTDIIQENLCIKRIISVIRGNNVYHHKLLKVDSRHSDAFVYVISGSCTYRFDDKIEYKAEPGDVFYLPYQAVYTMYIHTETYEFIFCDFEFEEISARRGSLYKNQRERNIDTLFTKLQNRYRSSSRSSYTECMSILYSIYSTLQQNADGIYLDKSKKSIMTEAKRYIDENFSRADISVSSIAESIGISEVYFRKLFRAQYGISPSRYMISARLKNAKALMKYPFLSLEDCALQSGFSSLQYFCRLFKKETGSSPGQYKKTL